MALAYNPRGFWDLGRQMWMALTPVTTVGVRVKLILSTSYVIILEDFIQIRSPRFGVGLGSLRLWILEALVALCPCGLGVGGLVALCP